MSDHFEKVLILIPTLNESKNIGELLKDIFSRYPGINVLVIDDSSQDNTLDEILKYRQADNKLFVLQRPERMGMGSAISQGFHFAVSRGFDYVITMEGDGSHSPKYITHLCDAINDYDVVIASRYFEGVRVDGWRFRKLLVSKLANIYVSYVLVKPIWDFTSGYRIYTRKIIKKLLSYNLENGAYIFQIQTIALAYKLKSKIKEIPFLYHDREFNPSKLLPKERKEAITKVWKYRAPLPEIFRHLTYVKKNYQKFVQEYGELLDFSVLRPDAKIKSSKNPDVSVGVMAYNEEKNIAKCLNSILQQEGDFKLKEILVVSSGSTDKTNTIVQEFNKKHPDIRLLIQPKRMGKASAINLYLSQASGEICVLESADTFMDKNCLNNLIKPFRDPSVGMTGAHPIPTNSNKGIINKIIHLMWHLHHLLALRSPKCGELVAFRNVIKKIPSTTAVDEASIESIITHHSWKLEYCPDAVVYNRGPDKLKDFIKQRKRIAIGHKNLKMTSGHVVSTASPFTILKILFTSQKFSVHDLYVIPIMIFLEMTARFLGWVEYYLKEKNPYIWDIVSSTKNLQEPDHKYE
ncbi:MAG: hypothetical protein Kow00108_00530 [Calditrichia bacterium]